jgi:hypothetical protein
LDEAGVRSDAESGVGANSGPSAIRPQLSSPTATVILALESFKAMKISELKPYEDKTVILHWRNGEIAKVKIAFVDAEYEDIIVDIVQTNRPEDYQEPIGSSSFAIQLSDLDFVEAVPPEAESIVSPE